MTLTILDPCTGTRVKVEVPVHRQATRRVRRFILRELDQAATIRAGMPTSSHGDEIAVSMR